MTRESKNVVLARWLDIPVIAAPDFYTSEEASALLLEKMPDPVIGKLGRHGGPASNREGWWYVSAKDSAAMEDNLEVQHADRKTAIAEACLAWISAEESK